MAANTFGDLFRLTTAGESHGKALVAIVDGCPPGIALTEKHIQPDLDRRKPGKNRFETPRREDDVVEILSGTFEGLTTGTPIALIIHNTDQRSQDYSAIKDVFRPAHADYTYEQKYGIRDYRGGGRSSARETAMRVAAGAIAKRVLHQKHAVDIVGFLSQLGPIKTDYDPLLLDKNTINSNAFFCPNTEQISELEHYMSNLKKEHNSIGAQISVIIRNVPVGLGDPVFDRLDATLAHALMSINAVKGVAIGDGFAVIEQCGTQHRDELTPHGFGSNHAGGILGGISTGQDIIVHIAMKPTSSIKQPGQTINRAGQPHEIVTKGRHDPCVGIRATPIAEAMVALTLTDHLLRHQGQCHGVSSTVPRIE